MNVFNLHLQFEDVTRILLTAAKNGIWFMWSAVRATADAKNSGWSGRCFISDGVHRNQSWTEPRFWLQIAERRVSNQLSLNLFYVPLIRKLKQRQQCCRSTVTIIAKIKNTAVQVSLI